VDLLDDVEEHEETYLLDHTLVNEAQVRRFHEYHKSRSDEVVEQFEYYFEQMSHYEQKIFIQKLQEMVDKK